MLMTFRFPANGCFSQPPTAEEPVTGSEALSSGDLPREPPAQCFRSNFARPMHVCLSKPAICQRHGVHVRGLGKGDEGDYGAHSSHRQGNNGEEGTTVPQILSS